MEVCPYSYLQWCGYFWGPWELFIMTDESQWGSQKLLQGLVSHEVKAYLSIFKQFKLMAILSKACKPDNFESHNSLKLSFTNIWGLHSNFDDCKSFLKSNPPEILALCETNLDDSIDSGNFSVRGYLPLIRKDSSTHMHGLAVYVKEGLPFAWDLSLENSADSYLCFRLALLHSLSYFFFLYRSSSSCLCTVFDSISSNIDEVLSINPSANVFVFGDFNVHHKDWLSYSGGSDQPGELCYNFSISNDLTQMILHDFTITLQFSYSDSRLRCSQSYSFGFLSFFWC